MFGKLISLVRGGCNNAYLKVMAVAVALACPASAFADTPIEVTVPEVNFNLSGLATKITDQMFPVIAMVGGVMIALLIAWMIFRALQKVR